MIIGLHGRARSGKDTACKAIQRAHPERDVIRKAFADLVKASLAQSLTIPYTAMNQFKLQGEITMNMEDREWKISGREAIVLHGMSHREIFGEDFWVDQLLPYDYDHEKRTVIVTDVRMINEAKRIKQLGGEIWRIRRPDVDTETDSVTEQMLPYGYVNRIIDNCASPERFEDAVLHEMTNAIQRDNEKRLMVASHGG